MKIITSFILILTVTAICFAQSKSYAQLSDLQNSQFQVDSLLAEIQTVSQEIDLITAGLQDIHQRLRSLQEQLKIVQQQNNGYMIMKQPESEITVLNSRIKTIQNTLSEKMKKMGKLQMRLNEHYAQGKMKEQQADRYDLRTGEPDTQENALKTLSLPSK